MNNRPGVPYTVQLMFAELARDSELATKIVSVGLGGMTQELLALAHSYAPEDLPMVLAAMLLTAQAMLPVMNEDGRQLMDDLVKHTTTITIDGNALRREE